VPNTVKWCKYKTNHALIENHLWLNKTKSGSTLHKNTKLLPLFKWKSFSTFFGILISPLRAE